MNIELELGITNGADNMQTNIIHMLSAPFVKFPVPFLCSCSCFMFILCVKHIFWSRVHHGPCTIILISEVTGYVHYRKRDREV